MNDIFRELKKGVDFDSEHNDAYTVVSQMLVEWCESRGRCFSDLIIKIKIGDYEDTVFESFDSNNYCFVSDYDWWEGENTIQILDIKRLEDVFDGAHGKWEHEKCTNCQKSLEDLFEGEFYYDSGEIHYCPNCGARMDLKDGEKKA
jgi:hypothetical protein